MSEANVTLMDRLMLHKVFAAIQGLGGTPSKARQRDRRQNICARKKHIWNPVFAGGFTFTDQGRVDAETMGTFVCRRCRQYDYKPFRRASSNNPPINDKPMPQRRNR